jgi:hypothetical protein
MKQIQTIFLTLTATLLAACSPETDTTATAESGTVTAPETEQTAAPEALPVRYSAISLAEVNNAEALTTVM